MTAGGPGAGAAAPDAAAEQAGTTTPARADETGRALASTFRTTVLAQLINTATGVILARSLGVTDRGELAAAILWPTIIGEIAALGLEEAATYHVARRPQDAGRVVGSGLVLWAIQSVVFCVVCAIVIPLALSKHGHATVVSALLYLVYIPLNVSGLLLNGVLNGLRRYEWYNRVFLSVGASFLVAQVILLATDSMAVRSMVIAYDVCYVAVNLYLVSLVARALPGRLAADRATVRGLFGYGVRSHASTTSSQVNQRLDVMVISIFLSARQLGLYVVAVAFTSMTGLVGGAVARVALPTVAQLGEGPRRTLLARRLISLTLILSAAVALPVVVLAPQLIELFFGRDYLPATEVTRILALGVIGFSMSRAIEAVLRAVGRPLDAGLAEFVALGVTFAGLAVGVPLLGLVGAGLASLLAYAVACVWMTHRAARALEVPWPVLFVPDRQALGWAVARARALRRRSRPDR